MIKSATATGREAHHFQKALQFGNPLRSKGLFLFLKIIPLQNQLTIIEHKGSFQRKVVSIGKCSII